MATVGEEIAVTNVEIVGAELICKKLQTMIEKEKIC